MSPYLAFAHSGGTNSKGCHRDRATGEYHCHSARADGAYERQMDGLSRSNRSKGWNWLFLLVGVILLFGFISSIFQSKPSHRPPPRSSLPNTRPPVPRRNTECSENRNTLNFQSSVPEHVNSSEESITPKIDQIISLPWSSGSCVYDPVYQSHEKYVYVWVPKDNSAKRISIGDLVRIHTLSIHHLKDQKQNKEEVLAYKKWLSISDKREDLFEYTLSDKTYPIEQKLSDYLD